MLRYHDGTKHHFARFAQSLGYLDWATQPSPFRSYRGALQVPLYPSPGSQAGSYEPPDVRSGERGPSAPAAWSAQALGDLFRHTLGLSAWKRAGQARWSLRVNPSSGNLHPTEGYLVCGPIDCLDREAGGVYHYMPDRHALERRCSFSSRAWADAIGGGDVALVGFTSIHWRESWKYGERAFRYCQHDLGHAMACLAIAAEMLGWRVRLVPAWSHASIAALLGLDRDEDFADAEREEPGCLLAITAAGGEPSAGDDHPDRLVRAGARGLPVRDSPQGLIDAVVAGRWTGHASQLSEDHVQWSFIDEVAAATADPGRPIDVPPVDGPATEPAPVPPGLPVSALPLRSIILQRRSAVAFDGVSRLAVDRFLWMLSRTMPSQGAPWRALWWTPRIHLAIFVHRVDGIPPGLYLLPRDRAVAGRLLDAMRGDFLREPISRWPPLVCLLRGDLRGTARRLSCDQDIASDGAFALAMIADFEASLDEYGPSFYRQLFWEAGILGQQLYLDAEACGMRATGIGCFYDDPVHDVLGLSDHRFQSLYHFTVGTPVDDRRLTVERGYGWEEAIEPQLPSIG